MKKGDPTVSFEGVTCMKKTEKAMLCLIGEDEHWIPLSQLSDDSEVFDDRDNSQGRLVVSEWIATTKKLV